MPEIIGSKLIIAQEAVDEKGQRLEPEQQPVAHEMLIGDARVTHGEAPTAHNFNTSVLAEGMTAGEVAQNLASNCRFCAHYDRAPMKNIVRSLMWGTREERETLQQLRAAMICAVGDDEVDDVMGVDALIVTQLGVCRAISEIKGARRATEMTYMHRLCGCPKERGPKGEDLSKLFKAREGKAARAAASARDDLLFTADGKEPE